MYYSIKQQLCANVEAPICVFVGDYLLATGNGRGIVRMGI